MWVIFVLASLVIGIAAFILIYIANKIMNSMHKDNLKARLAENQLKKKYEEQD